MTASLGRGLIRARMREPIRELITILNNLNDASDKHRSFQLLEDIYELREDLDTLIRAERDDDTPPEVVQLEDAIGDVVSDVQGALNGGRR
jgi:hypothetical protein